MASSSSLPQTPTAARPRTHLAFHHDAKLYKLATTVTAVYPFSQLEETNRLLFHKNAASASSADNGEKEDDHHVVVTEATIFHPQGGGQPSDVGTMSSAAKEQETVNGAAAVFDVEAVRMDALHDGQVLHYGRFRTPSTTASFQPGATVTQSIDIAKRLLYSRLHTAGHVLGAAVRTACASSIPGFDELKASHFPDSAACEFAGLIEGKWKDAIQKQVDAYIEEDMPVQVEWWDEEDFKTRGLERLLPPADKRPGGEGEKLRVVNIVGAEVYPCGGTHVDSTKGCGETKVKKISRSKGQSRVSYTVV